MIILALASGLLGLAASVFLRRSNRSGSGRGGVADDRFVYLSLPGFSLFLLGAGGLGLLLPAASAGGRVHLLILLGIVVAAASLLIGAVLSLWGLFAKSVPKWALPRSQRR